MSWWAYRQNRKSYITVLDIGSSKVCGLMAHIPSNGRPEVIGVGFAAAKGIKSGMVVDLNEATECIGHVLGQIEKQAERPVKSVTVNISSNQLKSRHLAKEITLDDSHPITAGDVKQLVDDMIQTIVPPEEEVLHPFAMGYSVDGEAGIADPRGLYARTLKAYVHVVTIPETQLRNLLMVLDRCHVELDRKVATPYAAALATLTDEEKEVGATVLDLGAGTTGYALFARGYLVHLGVVPIGGALMTRDIAQVLSTSLATAERLKTLNGAAFLSPKDELDRLIVPMIGEESETNSQIPKAELIKIIVPRLESILEQIGQKLAANELFLASARRLVLCGGGSALQGIKEKAEALLEANVRLSKAPYIKNLPNQFDSYTFVVCAGLLKYVLSQQAAARPVEQFDEQALGKSRFRKVLTWLVK